MMPDFQSKIETLLLDLLQATLTTNDLHKAVENTCCAHSCSFRLIRPDYANVPVVVTVDDIDVFLKFSPEADREQRKLEILKRFYEVT